MGVIPFTRAPSPRPAQHVLDSKERGHRPKELFRQNILGMGGCFFFLGLPLRRCVCLSSCRGLGSLGSLLPGVWSVCCVVFCCLSLGAFGVCFSSYCWLAVSFDVLSIRSIASLGHIVVCVVTDQMVGARRSPGRQYWGSRSCTSSANHRCQARRLVQNILTHLGVDGVRGGRLSAPRRVPLLGFVLGLGFALPEALRRHFLRAVAAAVFSSLSLRQLWLRVAAQASRTSHPRCFCSSDVEASCMTPCRGRRVPFSERRCGVIVCLQSRRRRRIALSEAHFNTSSICFMIFPSGVIFALRITGLVMLDVESINGPRSKAPGWFFSRPGSRLPQVKSTRLLNFQTRHKVA